MEPQSTYDLDYTRRTFQRIKRLGGETLIFDRVHIIGEENLHKNPERQRLYLANHLSHADYMIIWFKFHEKGIKMPMIPAGKNLDQLFFRLISCDFSKMGGFWVDRELLKSNINGATSHGRQIRRSVEAALKNKQDLLIFPEGGRSYQGTIIDSFLTGAVRAVLKEETDLDLTNIAFAYNPRIEEPVFPRLAEHRTKKGPKYKLWDYIAFARRLIEKRFHNVGDAYMNVSEPRPLIKIVEEGELKKRVENLRQYSTQEIRRLYEEISQPHQNSR
ncbi:hypothetical protein CMI41_00105 [Candidatus Pacearchaeota archaeon]|nr:hypothetical protein [Candidatus Pacearchaeota archaeon]|tara:strand:- start:2124 stop:2945 length:822 start_codon:yes stop_codon:yes gene_type:complete